ncbi:MAG TPA: ABC transporter permease [Bacteroidales bacterium]|nr:ABC transporter permease [Bacteroidales bacterium]
MTLKFAIRSLWKRPFLNLIKVIGLSLSLSGLLMIILYLKNELTFENFNENANRTYRLTFKYLSSERQFARVANTSFVPFMSGSFPEIEKYVRIAPVNGGLIRYNKDFFPVKEAFICDSTFTDFFNVKLVIGNPDGILNGPGTMIVSESFARKVFGNADPTGKMLTLPQGQFYGKNTDYIIKGVMKEFPQNSHLHPEFVVTTADRSVFEGWAWIYLLLPKEADAGKITSGFREFIAGLSGVAKEKIEFDADLQKISEIHLRSDKLREVEENSSMSVIRTLAIASLILLVIALANYANLNMAMAGFSEKFLFVSRISGSGGMIRFVFFLTEGLLVLFISIIVALFISAEVNDYILKRFSIDLFAGNTIAIISVIIIFGVLATAAALLPVMKWKVRAMTVTDLRNKEMLSRKSISRIMIVLQYAVSTALIIAVSVIIRQTNYALKNTMGAGNNSLICFSNVHSEVQSKFPAFKQELLKYGSVESVSAMLEPPGGEANDAFQFKMAGYIPDAADKSSNNIGVFPCDYSFAKIFGLDFLGGKDFSETDTDNEGSCEYIINESAMKRLNYSDPNKIIDKEFKLITNIPQVDVPAGRIIGVVRDFHLGDIKKKAGPLVMFKRKDLWLINFVVSFRPEMKEDALAGIEKVWKNMFPGYPFQYEYVSSMYKNVYSTEILESGLLTVFTIISLFICSMGLLGMSLLSAQRRTKEIGMRKINGAKPAELMMMLNRDMLKWVILSFIIAIPAAVFAMNGWLSNFAYKTELSWWIFLLSAFSSFAIAFLTISIQTWRTANLNPVNALRYE